MFPGQALQAPHDLLPALAMLRSVYSDGKAGNGRQGNETGKRSCSCPECGTRMGRLHIYLQHWVIFWGVNVGKYTSPIECLGSSSSDQVTLWFICCIYLLGRWLNFKLFGITYLVG